MQLFSRVSIPVLSIILFQLTACSSGGDNCSDSQSKTSNLECNDSTLAVGEARATPDSSIDSDTDSEQSASPDSSVTPDTGSEQSASPDSSVETDTDSEQGATQGGSAELDSTPEVVENGLEKSEAEPQVIASAGLTITPDPSSPFSKFQLADVLYTNNVYDGRQLDSSNNWGLISYDGVQDYVKWKIPVDRDSNGDLCTQQQPGSDLFLSYRLTSKKDSEYEKNTFVRSFPTLVVGTMGGRFESWGVECGNSTQLTPSIMRSGNSPVFDMTRVAPETGFPLFAGDLNSSVLVSVKADIRTGKAANGIANVFLDSYWHNVSDTDFLPGQDGSLKDTINGINSDATETWNLNIWFDWPRHEGSVSSWTGGFKIGQVEFSGDQQFDVYFKLEGDRDGIIPKCRIGGDDNCFLYIGLVTTDLNAARDGITVDYLEISNWLKSADFRDLFLTGAYQTDTPNANAYKVWRLIDGTDNDDHPDPAARGPRFPDDLHVIGGLHMGSELWFNPDANEAEIRFSSLGVRIEGVGTFGSYQDFR